MSKELIDIVDEIDKTICGDESRVRTLDQVNEGSLQPRKIALEEVVLSVLSYQQGDKVDKAEGERQTTHALHPVTVRTCLQQVSQLHQRVRVG